MLDTLRKTLDTVVMNNCNNLFRTERTVYCLKHDIPFHFYNACVLRYHTNEVTIGILLKKQFLQKALREKFIHHITEGFICSL